MKFCITRVLLVTLLILSILPLLPITPASAHEVEPVTASPAQGEVLQGSPDQVRLTFAEEIAEEGSSLQVFDSQGRQIDLGGGGVDLNDAQHAALVVGLPELSDGVYLVKWQVTLSDGDSSQGEYYFGVGNVTVPQPIPEVTQAETQPGSVFSIIAAVLVVIAVVLFLIIKRIRSQQ
jgi:methionine-rich copper-binding protein CopC